MPHNKKRSLLKYSRLPLLIVILGRLSGISRQIIFNITRLYRLAERGSVTSSPRCRPAGSTKWALRLPMAISSLYTAATRAAAQRRSLPPTSFVFRTALSSNIGTFSKTRCRRMKRLLGTPCLRQRKRRHRDRHPETRQEVAALAARDPSLRPRADTNAKVRTFL